MKVLDYEKVNGKQDRDDTILIAQLIPRPATSNSSGTDSTHETATVVENGTREGFDAKNIVDSGMNARSGPLSPATEAAPVGGGLV